MSARTVQCPACHGEGCHYFHARGRSWTQECLRCEGRGKVHAPPAITASDFTPTEKAS